MILRAGIQINLITENPSKTQILGLNLNVSRPGIKRGSYGETATANTQC